MVHVISKVEAYLSVSNEWGLTQTMSALDCFPLLCAKRCARQTKLEPKTVNQYEGGSEQCTHQDRRSASMRTIECRIFRRS